MQHIYREYDIRGIFQKELKEEIVKKIGFMLGSIIVKYANKVAVGYDARVHSPKLQEWLISGLNFANLNVSSLGLVPTPCAYYANYNDNFDASIMITGSHNPPEFNGFKITINKLPFFGQDIKKLGLDVQKLHASIPNNTFANEANTKEKYINFLVNQFLHLKNLPVKFAVDCGNGAGGVVISEIIKKLNLNATLLYENPDGTFPNHHPDPSEEKNLVDLKNHLSQNNINLGFAFDGDADRLGVITSKRNIKGDELVILYSKLLEKPRILGEVKCSQVMYDEIAKRGEVFMYKTGHSNIKMKIRELNIDIAAEVSGHLFFNDKYFGYDDAIYGLLRTLELVKNGINLDEELDKLPQTFSTDEIKIQTSEEEKFKIVEKLNNFLKNPSADFPKVKDVITIDGCRINFEEGWALLRASNTTPCLVTRFEAKSKENLELYQTSLIKVLKEFGCL